MVLFSNFGAKYLKKKNRISFFILFFFSLMKRQKKITPHLFSLLLVCRSHSPFITLNFFPPNCRYVTFLFRVPGKNYDVNFSKGRPFRTLGKLIMRMKADKRKWKVENKSRVVENCGVERWKRVKRKFTWHLHPFYLPLFSNHERHP